MRLHFAYDIVCPYAYLASRRVEALAEEARVPLQWDPVLLGGLLKSHGTPTVPARTWAPVKQRIGARDLVMQALRQETPLARPAAHPHRTVAAMRLLCMCDAATRPALSHALYRAYWVDGLDVADLVVLEGIARKHGVDPAHIGSPEAKEALHARTQAAVDVGIFGVPTFTIEGKATVDAPWFWGQDRMHMVRGALGVENSSRTKQTNDSGLRVRFFHDFSSPFSYLASTQIQRVAEATGATVEPVPILLGALFKAIGTPNVPLFAMSEAKRRYFLKDLQDWAEWWEVPFSFPSTFPVRTVLPLRVAIQEPAAMGPLYRALWVEDRDIGHPEVVAEVLRNEGFDAERLISGATEPEAKAALRANTALAEAAGACGVPTFQVLDPAREDAPLVLWGQDRLNLLVDLLTQQELRERIQRLNP